MFGRNKQDPSEPVSVESVPNSSTQALLERAMLWRTGLGPAYGVVEAAVECLVDGLDSPWLCELAGATKDSAGNEVYDLWPKVAEELSLANHSAESREAQTLAAQAYVRNLINEGRDLPTIVRIISHEFHSEGDDVLSQVVMMEWDFETNSYAKRPNEKLETIAAKRIKELLDYRG